MNILEFDKVSFRYPQREEQALSDISFAVEESEILLLCGQSGCGKTTLLRHMKKNQIPFGEGSGNMYFRGRSLEEMTDREGAQRIGFVGQDPEGQIVTDKVWHELAFGLESLGVSQGEIRRRVGEMAEYFGISGWFHQSVQELSGGQKQILNLASVMVMKPELLVLDEPTSQLDPIGAERFIHTLVKLNQDFGTTILLSEQRLEETLPAADRVMVLHQGRLVGITPVRQWAELLTRQDQELEAPLPVTAGLPVALRVYLDTIAHTGECPAAAQPLTVREGRQWLKERIRDQVPEPLETERRSKRKEKPFLAVEAKELAFSYERKGRRILHHFQMQVEKGSIYALLGGNGSGKTTALKVLAGIYPAEKGKIGCRGRTAYLPQDPLSLFTEITAEEELLEVQEWRESQSQEAWDRAREKADRLLKWMELEEYRKQNPYDLSGGQQQRLALAKVLMLEPDILLLDEPTKGLDAAFKKKLSGLLKDLQHRGMTVVMVSHDIEFCGENATHCGLLFDGQIINSGDTREFFLTNTFYTTAACRMTRGILPDCILCRDILEKMGF